jgi:CPA2 family monovalent cation:H+ antiporter-2
MAVLFAVCLVALEAGYSVALGAFLAGAVVGETKHVRKVETIVEPLRDVFCAVFFVAVGLHIDPSVMASLWIPILAGTGLVIFGKVAACTFGAFVAGYDLRTALRAGMGLGQIGEFSFVIAQLGLGLGVVSAPLYSIAVGISLLTALITPYLMRSSDRIVEVFLRRAPAPLVTYTELYGRWVAGLTAEGVGAQVWSVARKPILQTLLNVLAVTAILFGGRTLARTMAGSGAALDRTAEGLVWGGAFLIAMPFLIAAWRKTRAICLILAEGALAGRNLPEARALALRGLLANTGSLLAGILLGAWLLAASSPFLPPLPTTIGIAAFLAVLTAVLYRWMVRFQAGVQAGLQRLAAQPDQAPGNMAARGATAPALELMRRYYPYGGGAAEIVIPHGSPVAGRTLRDLSLRTATGATIVLIERGERRLIDPVDAPLAGGDRLLVMGEEDQIARARAVLESREPAPSGSVPQRPPSG